jgi:predicted  nucleic acid-binding Zn-ribbon protein
MKATPETQKELLRLQSLDTRIQQLEHAAKTLPALKTIAALEAQLSPIRQRLAVRTGALEDARTELSRIESDVAVVEARIARDTQRASATSSMKDVQAFESELASLRKRRSDLEDIELTVMERLEELEAAHAETVAERDAVTKQIAEAEAMRDSALAHLREDLEAVRGERSRLSDAFSRELLDLYERQRARYGIGAALLRGGVSLASNVKLTGSDLEAVRRAAPDDIVLCPDSSAILVRTEESGL